MNSLSTALFWLSWVQGTYSPCRCRYVMTHDQGSSISLVSSLTASIMAVISGEIFDILRKSSVASPLQKKGLNHQNHQQKNNLINHGYRSV